MLPAAATTCNPVLVSLQAAHHAVLILLHVTEMSNEMCTEILGTESTESWCKEGESHHVSREGTDRLSTGKPSVTSKNHSSPTAALVPPLLRSISGPSGIRLTPRRERGRLILEAVPCLIHHVQAEKNDIGGLALEAVLSFPYFQARRNDGRLRLSMPRSSPYNNNDNEEQEASDGEKVASDGEKVGLNGY
ncbi:PROTEIN FAF-LIKE CHLOROPLASTIC [Salix koriyanagi]|uniref:PROTEIN FAF-LIKE CHLOROPLASTIC n=1 Tax=Salix koriyanagi TaxID=2511006 RepID=A0A9Q0UYR4_9ROSI|nr:PROTEIN FAF-LIKE CHLOROPLASTIC [Salix koriyanagi]